MQLVLVLVLALCARANASPNIVLIVADDLGWNDVGFHGSNQVPTPSLDALAYSGLLLQNYYVAPICTPSRAALMTGKYPIHTGMQHGVIHGMEPRGLPLSERLLPQHLRALGYRTHLVGKWHLGHYRKEYLPLHRGFESHTGFWTGRIDMYDHTSVERGTWGTDFRRATKRVNIKVISNAGVPGVLENVLFSREVPYNLLSVSKMQQAGLTVIFDQQGARITRNGQVIMTGMEMAHDLFGKYATDVYTDEAIKIIKAHNKSQPLFLTVAHSAVHSGNPYEFIRAPDREIEQLQHIEDYQRRKFAALLSELDKSVGKVVEALHMEGLLHDAIIVFTTDNGGPAAGFNDNAASNYPLRGVKNTLWEGGVRGAGLLWSTRMRMRARSRAALQLMHVSDWLPTLVRAAGGNASLLDNIDGLDLWQELSKDRPSKRASVVHNIDDIEGIAAITVDKWKLVKGTTYNGDWDSWYGPTGRSGSYDLDSVYTGKVGRILSEMGLMPTRVKAKQLRDAATLRCSDNTPKVICKPLQAPCLFNIQDDPCERVNMASKEPQVLQRLLEELQRVNLTAVPPNNKKDDPRGDPKLWGHAIVNFGDYETGYNSDACS